MIGSTDKEVDKFISDINTAVSQLVYAARNINNLTKDAEEYRDDIKEILE
jgi:hypothetical protein